MSAKSKIEWTDATWTPIRAIRRGGKVGVHCEKVSPACLNCYAERLNMRNLPAHGTGLAFIRTNRDNVDIFCDEGMLMNPLRWKRGRRIFVCSQTDLFGEFVDEGDIAQVFAVMALAHWHTFQVLTKRSARMQKLLSSEDFWEQVDDHMTFIIDGEVDPLGRRHDDLRATAPEVSPDVPLLNVWLGVTTENQEWADKRLQALIATPAAFRFVSCEPLLGEIRLLADRRPSIVRSHIDWVIAGGESGPGARPSHPDWFRSLRDQCQAAEVAFFFKQWGEWAPGENVNCIQGTVKVAKWFNNDWSYCSEDLSRTDGHIDDEPDLYRIGKQAAGRRLDGQEWNEFPKAQVD